MSLNVMFPRCTRNVICAYASRCLFTRWTDSTRYTVELPAGPCGRSPDSTVMQCRGWDMRCWWRQWFSSCLPIPVDAVRYPVAWVWHRSRHRVWRTCGCRHSRSPTLWKHSTHRRYAACSRPIHQHAEPSYSFRCPRCTAETEPIYTNTTSNIKYGNSKKTLIHRVDLLLCRELKQVMNQPLARWRWARVSLTK